MEWKVEMTQVEIYPHPNADNLELAKVGEYQYVVSKNKYKTGDTVLSIPEKSLLPENLQTGIKNYLTGKNKDRVKSVKIRGEMSEGLILQKSIVPIWKYYILHKLFKLPLAYILGIKQYTPTLPSHLAGKLSKSKAQVYFVPHDCSQFATHGFKTFTPGELVQVTEKIHGTQINISFLVNNGKIASTEVTSKGLGKNGVTLDENDTNFYWQAFKQSNISKVIEKYITGLYETGVEVETIQIVGEAVPCQKGFDYGVTSPTIFIFRLIVNGYTEAFGTCPELNWVPLLAEFKYDPNTAWKKISKLANEKTSMLANHIREGVVVFSAENPSKYLKMIGENYAKKSTGEEFN